MPRTEEKISFEHKGIGDVLAHTRLVVPLNQRDYSWEEDHVSDLFNDFANAISKGTYFLGTIVLTRNEGDVPEVSDGQQRLATTTILLAAIRDYFFTHDNDAKSRHISSTFLTTTDIDTDQIVPKLHLNVDDSEFFKKYILEDPNHPDRRVEPSRESHRRIRKAAQIAAQHVRDILSPLSDANKVARLVEWVKFISKGAQVITLRVPDHLNAFVMFETLNDRGLKASQADLIKNHLLSFADNRIQEAQQKWARMVGILDSLLEGDYTVTYLHHLLITKFGPTKERDVYDKIKQIVNSQIDALQLLDELAESVNDYVALFSSDHQKWNDYGTSTRKYISTIYRDLRVEQIRPLMFAIARRMSVREAQLAFRLCVFWSVRFLIVGGRGGLLDRNYSLRAQDIGTGRITTAKELSDLMMPIIPNDIEFKQHFAEVRVSHNWLARYYLRAMELKRKGETEPELMPTDDEQIINLEHIMPEHPHANWIVNPDSAAANFRRLGNMVLLQATRNSIVGNSPFAEKKEIFRNSAFLLTSEAAGYREWGIPEIGERQQKLAEIAVETWPATIRF